MKKTALQTVAQVIQARPLNGEISPHLQVSGISIDSRTLNPGDLFFALPGEQSDGHEYVEAALAAGASGAVVKQRPPFRGDRGDEKDAVLLQVDDVLLAMQQLARWHRCRFDIPVIGVTGSTGKTTTKDLIASVLARRFHTLKTSGNYNNEIGLPLTLLALDETHQAAVVEMAMRGPGEIAHLCHIAAPNIGVITNVGHTHEELLGSQENIARAKGELLASLPPSGWAVLNGQDPWLCRISKQAPCPVLLYGLTDTPGVPGGLQVTASELRSEGRAGSRFKARLADQELEIRLPVPGEHNVLNSLAALSVGYLLGMRLEEMAEGLKQAQLSAMRLDIKHGVKQTTIINDAYNANPDSMLAALQVLCDLSEGRSIAVLGEMYELGGYSREGHNTVGAEAARRGVTLLVTVGKLAEYIAQGALSAGIGREGVVHFADNHAAAAYLQGELTPGDTVLVKGSRGMKMEQIVDALSEKHNS